MAREEGAREDFHVLIKIGALIACDFGEPTHGRQCIHRTLTRLSRHWTQEQLTMATKTLILLEDDIDGGTADETISFSLDGTTYEIDLSAKNAGKLRAALERYVSSARKTGGRRKAAPAAGKHQSTQAVREWARAQGLEVSERGRVAAAILAKYEAANH